MSQAQEPPVDMQGVLGSAAPREKFQEGSSKYQSRWQASRLGIFEPRSLCNSFLSGTANFEAQALAANSLPAAGGQHPTLSDQALHANGLYNNLKRIATSQAFPLEQLSNPNAFGDIISPFPFVTGPSHDPSSGVFGSESFLAGTINNIVLLPEFVTGSQSLIAPGPSFDPLLDVYGGELFLAGTLDNIVPFPEPATGSQLLGINNANIGGERFHDNSSGDTAFNQLVVPRPVLGFAGAAYDAFQANIFQDNVFPVNALQGVAAPQQSIIGLGFGVIGENLYQGYHNGELPYPQYASPTPVPEGQVNENERTVRPQQFSCGNKCDGNFSGPHQCFRYKKALMISCSGCRVNFTKRSRQAFNRHYETVHMHPGAQQGPNTLLDCSFPGCKRVGAKGFNPARPDNILHHRRLVHQEDIPGRKVRFLAGKDNIKSRQFKGAEAVEDGEVEE